MGITRVSNQLWMEPLRYESCPLGMGWCVAHAWPTPCVAHAWLTPILAAGYQCRVLWDGLVRGSCVVTPIHPTFWNVKHCAKMVGARLKRGPHRAWLMRGSHPS